MRELAKESFTVLSETRIKLALFHQAALDFESSEEIFQKVLEEAKGLNDKKIQAECLADLATLFLAKYEVGLEKGMRGEEEENDEEREDQVDEEELLKCVTHSIAFGEESLKICYGGDTPKESMNSVAARSANHAMGEAYMHLGETEKALPHFEQVLEISRKSKSEDLPEILLSCAKAYFGAAEGVLPEKDDLDDEAEEDLTEEQLKEKKQLQVKLVNQSLALFKENMEIAEADDVEGKSTSLAGFVSCYELLGETEKMIESQKQILEIDEQQEDPQSIIQSLAALADMLEEANKPEEAMANYKKALELAQKEDSEDLIDTLKEKIDELQANHKESLQPKKRRTKE
eukprot:TRINITY_DN2451_c0_g2_i2.p1 TRINITY_DN2451_c0_g2~~TRINITY_DN2451_c0_g2_i2.p1  ORF type:complete len:346 (+),score=124.56 TRINITY_DN2451_c0_g2_i2:462-1499(+)